MPKAVKEKRARTTTEEAASTEAGPSTITPKLPPLYAEGDDEEDNKKKRKSADGSIKKKKKKTPGIVYISRIPPGMTPHKVRHLMEHWGEVGRVFAQPRDGKSLTPSHTGREAAGHRDSLADTQRPRDTTRITKRRRRSDTSRPTTPRRGSSTLTSLLPSSPRA